MDPTRFDHLSRAMGATGTRRNALLVLGTLALGSLLGHAPETVAKRKPKHCPRTEKHCGRRCIPKAHCCTSQDCPARQTCRQGQCRCVPTCRDETCGTADGCGGVCACAASAWCQAGHCTPCDPPCARGQRCVHGVCTCDAFDNQCPTSADGQCSCGGRDVDELGPFCLDRNSACDLDTPCETNDDCQVGRVCQTTCVDPGDPLGPNRCSNPCVPG
jgi:hypothetical protein